MKKRTDYRWLKALGLTTLAGVPAALLINCGSDSAPPMLSPSTITSQTGLANYSLDCTQPGGTLQLKQAQVALLPQSQQCTQRFQFQSATAPQFDFSLDCESNTVVVYKRGGEEKLAEYTVDQDGTVSGTLQFSHKVDNDGRGRESCWVQFDTKFDGKASCPAATGNITTAQQKSLTLTTQVSFNKTNAEELLAAGVISPEQLPGIAAPASPSPGPSLSVSPIPSVAPSPSNVPGPITPSPVVLCLVEDPCQLTGIASLSCGPGPSPSTTASAAPGTSPSVTPSPSELPNPM